MAKFIVKGLGEFVWDREKLSLKDALELEKATGTRLADLVVDYNGYNDPSGHGKRGMLGITAFLWHAMRINNHITPFSRMLEELSVDDVTEDFSDEGEAEAQPDPQVEPPATAKRRGSAQKKASSATK